MRSYQVPECSRCGQSDQVEDSVLPKKWDGYCYRCMAPFKAKGDNTYDSEQIKGRDDI